MTSTENVQKKLQTMGDFEGTEKWDERELSHKKKLKHKTKTKPS